VIKSQSYIDQWLEKNSLYLEMFSSQQRFTLLTVLPLTALRANNGQFTRRTLAGLVNISGICKLACFMGNTARHESAKPDTHKCH